MGDHNFECIDVGSENCPCYLALTGDCLVCSRLQGKEECDCNWKGVCVYNEFIQGNKRINNPRSDTLVKILYKKYYLDDLVVFCLKVGKGFAIKAGTPGSYVFLREKESEPYYETPLCVMSSNIEDGTIAIAVKIISAKTKALAEAEGSLIVRGIYRNGILGVEPVTSKSTKEKKVLIIAKGIGLAPGILTSNYLWQKNSVDLIIDKEKISEDLMTDYLGEGDGTIRFMNLNENSHCLELEGILAKEKYNIVILFTSDYFQDHIGSMIKKLSPDSKVAVSNNFHICCGEGICGSCTTIGPDGKVYRMCKCNNKKSV